MVLLRRRTPRMNWAWVSSLDHIWRSPNFPMWLTLAAAGFFGLIVLITLLRAEKSVANGALTVITLLAIGIAVAATLRGFSPAPTGRVASGENRSFQPASPALPALACIGDLAGETVLNACEKALFGSAEAAAAAVDHAASQITRLTAAGDLAVAEKNSTTELRALRRAVERDRYGLMAYVLMARDHCTPAACAAYRSLGDNHLIAANMKDRVYESLIARYAPSWNAAVSAGQVAAQPPSGPTGKPTNAEFPTSASTPPVNIMTPEPMSSVPAAAASRPAAAATSPALAAQAAAKKPAAPKRPTAPVQIAPSARAPAALNE
jgi:hypothetical protein